MWLRLYVLISDLYVTEKLQMCDWEVTKMWLRCNQDLTEIWFRSHWDWNEIWIRYYWECHFSHTTGIPNSPDRVEQRCDLYVTKIWLRCVSDVT